MKISPSLAVCRRSLRAVLSRVTDDNIETHSQKLPQDLIRPTLFVLWFGVTRSEVKRAFFATLLYIYLLDPLQFIRGGPLFDDVRLLPLCWCRPSVEWLPSNSCWLRRCWNSWDGFGMEGEVRSRMCSRAFLLCSMRSPEYQRRFLRLQGDGVLRILMRNRRICNMLRLFFINR